MLVLFLIAGRSGSLYGFVTSGSHSYPQGHVYVALVPYGYGGPWLSVITVALAEPKVGPLGFVKHVDSFVAQHKNEFIY